MKITREDVIKRTKGELSRLFASAQADLSRQPVHSAERRQTLDAIALIKSELSRHP